MTAAECLEHKWLKEPTSVKPLPSPAALPSIVPGVSSSSLAPPLSRVSSVNDSPSGQRRALASTLTDDEESDDTSSLHEPAKKLRCEVELKQDPVLDSSDRPSSSEDKENLSSVDVEKPSRNSATTPTTTTTVWKFESVETSSSTLCSTPTTAAVAKTLVAGVCIDISVA